MSLDKGIFHGKERRRVYRRSAAFDRSCRPGGNCPYCRRSRLWSRIRAERAALEQIREWQHGR